MNASKVMWICALASVAICGVASAQEPWKPVAQPDLKEKLDAAPALEVEDVCVPVRTVNRDKQAPCSGLWFVPNPDGKSCDALLWYYPAYDMEHTLVVFDFGTGKVHVKPLAVPLRHSMHSGKRAAVGADGKLYVTCENWPMGLDIFVYDPAANEMKHLGLCLKGLVGEKHSLRLGTDGKLYGAGSYIETARAGVFRIDTETGRITDYGPVGPSNRPNDCRAYSVAADNEYIYVATGKTPWRVIGYNRRTGKDAVLLETELAGGAAYVYQQRYGCTASARNLKGVKNPKEIGYWLYKGRAIQMKDGDHYSGGRLSRRRESPPWPMPAKLESEARYVTINPTGMEFFTDQLDPGPDGKAVLWYRSAATKAAAPPNPPADATPEQLGWRPMRFRVGTRPVKMRFVTEMPDGRIMGAAVMYQGFFAYDPRTDKAEYLGRVGLSTYCATAAAGKMYLSGYPSSAVFEYDPARPWTAGKARIGRPAPKVMSAASNPRHCINLMYKGARAHKMYAAVPGADGKIYFAGQCYRDAHGGGLGWWDPKAEEGGGLWKPFTAYITRYLAATDDGRQIVISTATTRDTYHKKPAPAQGKLFIYDVKAGKITADLEPFEGIGKTGPIAEALPGKIMGAAGNMIYGVDVATARLAFSKEVPYGVPFRSGEIISQGTSDFRMGPDGHVWTYLKDVLVRIDPKDARVRVVGRVEKGGRMAFAGRDVYLAGTPTLRRIRGVVPVAGAEAEPKAIPPRPKAIPSQERKLERTAAPPSVKVGEWQKRKAKAAGVPVTRAVDIGGGETLKMAYIPAGSFMMGSPETEPGRYVDEGPRGRVAIPKGFYMGICEINQAQWRAVMGADRLVPRYWGDNRPVERVNWIECREFVEKLSERTGLKFRLPTEAEWEYACRAGTGTAYAFGKTISTTQANYCGDYLHAEDPKTEYRQVSTNVGTFAPNAWGLYDMHGNVWEWCDSLVKPYPYDPADGRDHPTVPQPRMTRIAIRGGAWNDRPNVIRSAFRGWFWPKSKYSLVGLRVAAEAE